MSRNAEAACIAEVCALEFWREESARERAEVAAPTARQIAAEQAEDEGLWFDAETVTEDYLQRALRRLAAAVEAQPDISKSYADAIAQVVILTAERDAVIRQRDAWAECYHALAEFLHVPEC